MRAETILSDDVDPAVQKLLEFDEELGEVEEAPPVFEVDEEVDVTVGAGLPTYDRSEYSHIRGAVGRGDREDLISMSLQCRVDAHADILLHG